MSKKQCGAIKNAGEEVSGTLFLLWFSSHGCDPVKGVMTLLVSSLGRAGHEVEGS